MGIGLKIRALLILLSIGCIITSLTVSKSHNSDELLTAEATVLEENLQGREIVIRSFINNAAKINEAKTYHLNGAKALNFIKRHSEFDINIFTYEGENMLFWSTSGLRPQNINSIKEGISFLQLPSGYYECIKKTDGSFSVLVLVTIKNQFNIDNQYLVDDIKKQLSPSGLLEIASFNDPSENLRPIKTSDGKYLFSVKLKDSSLTVGYNSVDLWLWMFGIVFFCFFVNSLCGWIARRGKLFLGTFLLLCFIVVFRLSDLEFGWINRQYDLAIFNPQIYAESYFSPSLGDLLLNVLVFTWFITFVYVHRVRYTVVPTSGSKIVSILVHVLLLTLISFFAFFVDDVFFGLIYNSKIAFDINIINLNWVSWVCVLLICLAWTNIFLLTVIFVRFTYKYPLSNKTRLAIFLAALIGFALFRILTNFTAFFILYAIVIFIIAFNIYVQNRKFSLILFTSACFFMAFITSVKYTKFTDIRERTYRNTIAQKLETSLDLQLVNAFNVLEIGINDDPLILNYFNQKDGASSRVIENHLFKKYLDGFVGNFDINLYSYDAQNVLLGDSGGVSIDYYRDLVLSGALKTPESNRFYKVNDTFGYQNYFGIIPVFNNGAVVGTIVLDLKTQPYNYNLRFPEVLLDGKIRKESDYFQYSFAFYNHNKLVNQSGEYSYDLINDDFKAEEGKIVYNNEKDQGINHLVYAPTANKIIVITKDKVDYATRFAALSFFFLIFITYASICFALIWVLKSFEDSSLSWYNINKYLMINANQVLYRTRIQVSITLVVVSTLIAVGWTTFYYISQEYKVQQFEQLQDKIRKLKVSFEKQIYKKGSFADVQSATEFDQFADLNGVHLNLYNAKGDLIMTSLQKIFDSGIQTKKMDAVAFIYLSKLHRSEFINTEEMIGDFQYASAYMPIKDEMNQTVAYLGAPFFSNQQEYESKIELFINTLINIYALVFVVIGLLAVFIANQITSPLTFIQQNIKRTKFGQLNQPIQWSRHDEIGSLIKEYNKMISALETSAKKLARSEREIAWREMAKQVAHEIKNPLTPLKLGVQLLERSWREKDPNFEKKFENFNRSFIEQIDSLANIASEFGSFAKMPDTKLEHIELIPIIEKAKDVYNKSENAEINVINKVKNTLVLGDKDQFLRMFNNLFKNAIEAGPENQTIQINVLVYEHKNKLMVSISDNGRGISNDLRELIFMPNFTTKSSGTGLGLAFVKQAIENAGGDVHFTSAEGEGTVFYLTFPFILA